MSDVKCPLPECDGQLHITWMAGLALTTEDLANPPNQSDAHTATWTVDCSEGHVVLLPGLTGCPCDDPEDGNCPHPAQNYDWSEDIRSVRPHDMRRLAKLLNRLGGTP